MKFHDFSNNTFSVFNLYARISQKPFVCVSSALLMHKAFRVETVVRMFEYVDRCLTHGRMS